MKLFVVVTFQDRLGSHPSPLKAEKFDVRKPLPAGYQGAFDVFSCDPVETLEGIKLYISRGTSGLRGIGILYLNAQFVVVTLRIPQVAPLTLG